MVKRIAIYLALVSATMYAATALGAPAAKPAAKDDMVFVAECNNGKKYYHKTGERRGACSGQSGVKVWADGTAPKSSGGRSAVR